MVSFLCSMKVSFLLLFLALNLLTHNPHLILETTDKSGMINFMEFVCTLWNLLTLPESDFGSVAYLLRDPSGESEITCKPPLLCYNDCSDYLIC